MHILCAFWSFVLMALHLGLHWNMILGHIGRAAGLVLPRPARTALGIAGAAAAVYGLYAFLKNQLLSYLFLTPTSYILTLNALSFCLLQNTWQSWNCSYLQAITE